MKRAARAQTGEDTAAEFRITEFPLHYVVFIQKYAQAAFARVLEPFGLTNQTWRVLAALSDGRPRTIGQLADATVFDRANLGRLIETMARDRLVTRTPDPADRRVVRAGMAAEGRRRFDAAHPAILNTYGRLLDGLDGGDQAALMAGLTRMKANCIALCEDLT